MTNTFRLDGDSEAVVSDAYDFLQEEDRNMEIDQRSALNIGNHPQSSTALDIITTKSMDEIRDVFVAHGFAVSVEVPNDAELENAML
jgi:hypothetical protein